MAQASILFLVDAKLVLLQPSTNEEGELKYEMRVIASNVEYFDLMRDQHPSLIMLQDSPPSSPLDGETEDHQKAGGLRDSLWYFDGDQMQCWTDIENLLRSIASGTHKELPTATSISTDFYPSSIVFDRGIVLGIDADLLQRRDAHFAFFRLSVRVSFSSIHYLFRCLQPLDATLSASNSSPLYYRL